MCLFLALELKSCSWNENKDVGFIEMSFFNFAFELFGHLENVKLLSPRMSHKFRVLIATFGQNVMKFKIFYFSVSSFLRCNTVTCSRMQKPTYYFRLIPLANETGLFQYSYVEVTMVKVIRICFVYNSQCYRITLLLAPECRKKLISSWLKTIRVWFSIVKICYNKSNSHGQEIHACISTHVQIIHIGLN